METTLNEKILKPNFGQFQPLFINTDYAMSIREGSVEC